MKRRAFCVATTALIGGCLGSGESTDDEESNNTDSNSEEEDGVMDPEYLGIHDDHDGPEITDVEYQVHSACQATVMFWFDEKPDPEKYLSVWFYMDGERADRGTMKIGELDMEEDMRDNFKFQFCTLDKYNEYEVAVVSEGVE